MSEFEAVSPPQAEAFGGVQDIAPPPDSEPFPTWAKGEQRALESLRSPLLCSSRTPFHSSGRPLNIFLDEFEVRLPIYMQM